MAQNAESSDQTGGAAPDAAAAVTIELAPEIGFVTARELHAELLAVRERAEVVFDASKVQTLSTAALLVLISFLNARSERTPPAAVLSPSGPFVDAFSELGLFGSLMRMEFRT